MSRKAYDDVLVTNISRMDIDIEHPNWSLKQKNAELNSIKRKEMTVRKLTIIDLKERLFKEYDGTHTMLECANEAKYLMDNMPPELIVNVNEYLDQQPLTDIKIHGVSINDVFAMFSKSRPMHFIRILHCMTEWRLLDYFNEDFCWNYFARA